MKIEPLTACWEVDPVEISISLETYPSRSSGNYSEEDDDEPDDILIVP
jgi:hypothetical protein